MGKCVSRRCSTSIHTADTWMPPKQRRDSKTAPPPFKLTLFDLLSLECKDCYCLHHREFKHPTTSTAHSPTSVSTLCASSLLENFKKRAEELFPRNQIVIFTYAARRKVAALLWAGKLVGQWSDSTIHRPNDHFSACLSTSISLYWSKFLSWSIKGKGRGNTVCFWRDFFGLGQLTGPQQHQSRAKWDPGYQRDPAKALTDRFNLPSSPLLLYLF